MFENALLLQAIKMSIIQVEHVLANKTYNHYHL